MAVWTDAFRGQEPSIRRSVSEQGTGKARSAHARAQMGSKCLLGAPGSQECPSPPDPCSSFLIVSLYLGL